MSEHQPSTVDIKELAPYLAAAVIVAVMVMVLMMKFLPIGASRGPATVVTFDVIKYTNAQRAVASAFVRPGANIGAANELLLNMPERTRAAISEVAGSGTLVMVKQSVVQGQYADITDDVLKKLGLPSAVPTNDATEAALEMAPTSLEWLKKQDISRTQDTQGASNEEVMP